MFFLTSEEKMSADTLTTPSRDFYENSKIKVAISLTFAGIGLLLLGFASLEGGIARASSLGKDQTNVDWVEDALEAQAGGFGFSCFSKLMGAILAFAVSIYYSPVFCGSVRSLLSSSKLIQNLDLLMRRKPSVLHLKLNRFASVKLCLSNLR